MYVFKVLFLDQGSDFEICSCVKELILIFYCEMILIYGFLSGSVTISQYRPNENFNAKCELQEFASLFKMEQVLKVETTESVTLDYREKNLQTQCKVSRVKKQTSALTLKMI